jgi:hypothetical protein
MAAILGSLVITTAPGGRTVGRARLVGEYEQCHQPPYAIAGSSAPNMSGHWGSSQHAAHRHTRSWRSAAYRLSPLVGFIPQLAQHCARRELAQRRSLTEMQPELAVLRSLP